MHPAIIAALVIAVLLLLGTVVFPAVNKRQFDALPFEQKVRILMKEANSLSYFKDVAFQNSGTLYYVKNKRKILLLPWEVTDGEKRCTREEPLAVWDYPENVPLTDEEKERATAELTTYFADKKMKMRLDNEFNN